MKRIAIYCLLLWSLVGIAVAGYDTNIGAYQADSAGGGYDYNIGADQTDEAAAPAPAPAAEAATGAQVILVVM